MFCSRIKDELIWNEYRLKNLRKNLQKLFRKNMLDTANLRPTVNLVVRDLVKNFGYYSPTFEIAFASKNGDSFSGEVYRIIARPGAKDIEDFENNNVEGILTIPPEVRVIAKIPPKNSYRREVYNSASHFSREKYVYEFIFPVFERFQCAHLKESHIFNHYPDCITAGSTYEDEYVLLSDLALQSFTNSDRPSPLCFEKCAAVLKTIAKFHAISFAMKDQQPGKFMKLTSQLQEIMFTQPPNKQFATFLKKNVEFSLSTLDPKRDKLVIKKLLEFRENYAQFMADCCSEQEDAIILHGDCWISNILFRRNKGSEDAYDIKFLDWQVVRYGTVAIDLSYFIFCCTDAKLRKRLPQLLEIYWESLTNRIDELGSNGRALFPYEKLQWHMKKYSKFGLGMAMITLHATCCKSKDLTDVQAGLDEMNLNDIDKYTLPLLANPVYKKRMSEVLRDFYRMDLF